MKVRIISLSICYFFITKRKPKGDLNMGEILLIVGLALYVPMSMVFVFCR